MNILRTLTVGLATFVCIVAVSGLVYLLTLNTTIMDRTVVKGWLSESKIYDGKLVEAFVQATGTSDVKSASLQSQGQLAASSDMIEAALSNTFTPQFVQTQTESTIDSAYDWIDGKQATFTFSIPVDQQRNTLIQQLATAIEPQVASLPVCTAALAKAGTACRPSNLTVTQMASQLASTNVASSDLFTAPLTNESFAKYNQATPQSPQSSPLTQLPAVRSGITTALIVLPFLIIASIAIIVGLTPAGRRVQISSRLAIRIFFGLIITFIGALAVSWFVKNNDLGLSSLVNSQSVAIGAVIGPLLQLIVGSIASQLALFSGIACGVSLASWIGLKVWQKKLRTADTLQQPTPTPIQPQTDPATPPTPLQ